MLQTQPDGIASSNRTRIRPRVGRPGDLHLRPPFAVGVVTSARVIAFAPGVAAGHLASAGAQVDRCDRIGELYDAIAAAGPGTLVLVDVTPRDPDAVWRPTERVIARATRIAAPREISVVGWTRQDLPDVVAGTLAAGADACMRSSRDSHLSDGVRLALMHDGGPGAVADDAKGPGAAELRWRGALQERYGLTWEWWTEAALIALAGTGERTPVAQSLADAGYVPSLARGIVVLRELSKTLAREEYRNAWLVAREAHTVLAGLAAIRPLLGRPLEPVSLETAARVLRVDPDMAAAAHLSEEERADLSGLVAIILRHRARLVAPVGAPAAGQSGLERRWAAGQRALASLPVGEDVDRLADQILDRATAAAHAVMDIVRDPVDRTSRTLATTST